MLQGRSKAYVLSSREFKSTYTVDFNYSHIMPVNPEVETGESAGIDDPQTVRFTALKWQRRIVCVSG